jgi:hypothetical protein
MALIVYQTSPINSKKVWGIGLFFGSADRPAQPGDTGAILMSIPTTPRICRYKGDLCEAFLISEDGG